MDVGGVVYDIISLNYHRFADNWRCRERAREMKIVKSSRGSFHPRSRASDRLGPECRQRHMIMSTLMVANGGQWLMLDWKFKEVIPRELNFENNNLDIENSVLILNLRD